MPLLGVLDAMGVNVTTYMDALVWSTAYKQDGKMLWSKIPSYSIFHA